MKTNPLANIPHDRSSSQQWILWHKSLKSNYGRKRANQIFIYAWDARKNYAANTTLLRNYMRSQGVDLSTGILGQTADGINSIGDSLENAFGFAGNTLKITVIILVLGVAILTYNIANNPELIGKILIPGK